MESSTTVQVTTDLEKLGFTKAAANVKRLSDLQKKMMIAYEFYRFATQEQIDRFNKELKRETEKGFSYDMLTFTSIQNYEEVPPTQVLEALAEAVGRQCFDSFEIAHIVKVTKVPDPILFGRIVGCPDRFYIAQWDEDVKIEDILSPNEG